MSSSPFEAPAPVPSRRRPRREDVVTYRIRLDLDGAGPPIWRRLEVASDLSLDQVHDIVQTAMGWSDTHLHEFACGDSRTDRGAEHYRPQASLDNDLPGIDENSVRLDEVLQAGYLPPVHVEAVADLLNLEDIWIGKNNREVQTYPVLEFRELSQRLGLLRKVHNKLTVTKAGARARADVDALWRLVIVGIPLGLTTRGPEVRASLDAGLLLLIGVAAKAPRLERNELVAECLDLLGWRASPIVPLTERDVHELLSPTEAVLEHVGAIPRQTWRDSTGDGPPDNAGAAFAQAALRLSGLT